MYVFLSMYSLLVDTRRQTIKNFFWVSIFKSEAEIF